MSIQDITIVITSFRSDEKIKVCLKSIKADCKVIIVENSNNMDFKKNVEEIRGRGLIGFVRGLVGCGRGHDSFVWGPVVFRLGFLCI